jgi:hypothetical protein
MSPLALGVSGAQVDHIIHIVGVQGGRGSEKMRRSELDPNPCIICENLKNLQILRFNIGLYPNAHPMPPINPQFPLFFRFIFAG